VPSLSVASRTLRVSRRGGSLAVGIALSLVAAAAEPCSICRCGDPTFNALGKAGYSVAGFRFALDWERYDKQEGPPELAAEELVEQRLTALVAYGFSDSFTLQARIPVSFRDFEELEGNAVTESFTTRGLSDPELSAQLRFWASPLTPLGHKSSLSLVAGIKSGLGENDYSLDGERVDEHAQPGTGSTDPFLGIAGLHLFDKRSALFASIQYRHTGENDHGYRYGQSFLANVAYERKLGTRLDSALELNFRHAGADEEQAEEVPNTGGSILYLTPRLLVDLGGGVVLRGAVQIPIARDLNGAQKEHAVFNVGLSFLLGSN
jgi:outer membrane putative beta-barrel porin/alpha-amylase